MESLVSTEWLERELGAPDLRILDSTLFLPGEPRDPRSEFEAEHIPGARFLDLADVADSANPLPHMFPPEAKMASRMAALGVGDSDRLVVYDNSPIHTAARGWFMLRSFGARQVAILDGGFQKWKAEGWPVESGSGEVRRGHFTPRLDSSRLVDKAAMLSLVGDDAVQIVDARGASRFTGEEAEPRAGMASGRIPGSKNLPQGKLFKPDHSWKRGEALRAEFEAAGVDLDKPLVTTCGSGVTACILLFGAHLLGRDGGRLYDGSWSEWGADPSAPKATGPA
jgi:thiosulfate/3-mercaptopyruvate sulfurtransferase